MIQLSLKTDFSRLERALMALADKQVKFAAAQALNDCTRAARDRVNRDMPSIFDRPTPFTNRAVVAPRELAATPDRLAAVVTLRPIQARYLLHEEEGGTRTATENTRRQGAALVLPSKALPLDQFGNIPNRTLAQLARQAKADRRARRKRAVAMKRGGAAADAAPKVDDTNTVVFLAAGAPGNKAGIGGYFRRLSGHRLARLTAFAADTHYRERFSYHRRVDDVVRATWPEAMRRRLHEAIATAR